MVDSIIARSSAKGLRMSDRRRTIARVIEQSDDHPDIGDLQDRIATRLGYRLKGYRLKLYGAPLKKGG